jgi:hypothetical protein
MNVKCPLPAVECYTLLRHTLNLGIFVGLMLEFNFADAELSTRKQSIDEEILQIL